MRARRVLPFSVLLIVPAILIAAGGEVIRLPRARTDGGTSLEETLSKRRSIRDFDTSKGLTLEQLGQLLWACQGITSPRGLRTAPSAGALYPLEIYAVVSRVESIEPGIYHYLTGPGVGEQSIEIVHGGEFSSKLSQAALGQESIQEAAVNVVIGGIIERTAIKYGGRAGRYVLIEVGHAGQNVVLQATALGLGAVTIGAFSDDRVRDLIGADFEPFYIIPVGIPK